MRSFIITIDTEGDNLWAWKQGKEITTNNSKYLSRFQNLCNEYGFKVVWLCNWEMIHDPHFVQFVMKERDKGNCEIGMHLHAWNTPPYYNLPHKICGGAPYLIEYPNEVIESKIATITEEIHKIMGHYPVTHRAGRWAVNDDLILYLKKYGYKVDCSITPGIDWRSSKGQTAGFKGPNYVNEMNHISYRNGIMEVPLTTIQTGNYFVSTFKKKKGIEKPKYLVKKLLHKNRIIYLRPDGTNLEEMEYCVKTVTNSEKDYIMFMLHSSELMPGGSPTFRDQASIENLYDDLKILFEEIKGNYVGSTLEEFYIMHNT